MRQPKLIHAWAKYEVKPTGRWFISPPSFGEHTLYIESKRKWYLPAEWVEDCYVQEVNNCHDQ